MARQRILSPTTLGDDRGMKLDASTHGGLFAISGPRERVTLPVLGEITLDDVYDGTGVPRVSGF